jgi:tetratricopeptide (TPR) repeat protein
MEVYILLKAMMKKHLKNDDNCIEDANSWANKSERKAKRYFMVIADTCQINKARIAFRNRDYEAAIKLYNKVPKASFKWPFTLLEKAWSYYYLGDYNRSLGILITYNSPLLESYFTPEAEILKALNYYELCLYDDALEVIHRYYDVYKPRSESLKSVIATGNNKELYFFDLMFKPIAETEQKSKFIRNVVTQVSKRVKYNLDINSLYTLNTEIIRSSKGVNMERLVSMQLDLKEQINHYVKVSIYRLINQIHEISFEMFNIKLEILSRKRDLVYRNKELHFQACQRGF